MARRPRQDEPGSWHHVVNRGVARRTMFERWEDVACFLDHLGRACERGELEVHAYCVLTTHYHVLVRSLGGVLATAMQRVQTEYSRWFNRRRRRDGALVRGRYASKRIDSVRYRCAVVSYIDRNPVAARLVRRSADYPHGSARAYAGAADGPSWMCRTWIERMVAEETGLAAYDSARYEEVFARLPATLARVVEARWRSGVVEDPLDDLLSASGARVLDWMRRKAALADGTAPGIPIVDGRALDAVIRREAGRFEKAASDAEPWRAGRRDLWMVLRVGLSRQLCGERMEEIGWRVGMGKAAVSARARDHARLLQQDALYAERALRVSTLTLRAWNANKSVRRRTADSDAIANRSV